ncbi:hypothetical protein HY750_02995 [Candidatus Kuenenbacteria bacterium]|nr:hypothetical protein [Candidatus Kuenenbacteria bacterium]
MNSETKEKTNGKSKTEMENKLDEAMKTRNFNEYYKWLKNRLFTEKQDLRTLIK